MTPGRKVKCRSIRLRSCATVDIPIAFLQRLPKRTFARMFPSLSTSVSRSSTDLAVVCSPTSRPVKTYFPKTRTSAVTSKDVCSHMPSTSANCSLISRVLIHQDGFLAGAPSIRQMRKVFVSTQISPFSSPFSFFLGMSRKRYVGCPSRFSSRRKANS